MSEKAEFRPRLNRIEMQLINEHRGVTRSGISDAAKSSGLSESDVKHGWIKTDNQSVFFTNPMYGAPDINFSEIDFGKLFDNVPKIKRSPRLSGKSFSGIFDRLVYTDVHIAMNPNVNGNSQYGGKWDAKEVDKRVELMINHTIENQESNTIIVDDLGDFMDGFNAKTTRRAHDLPQNMSDQEAYDVGLSFKWKLFVALAEHYNTLVFNNICNDNHSGAFGYTVNSAFKKMVEVSCHEGVTVINHNKFINHYRVHQNTFVICHGKDKELLKFGFKPKLDPAQMEKISNYIDHEWLMEKDGVIEFSKGDSHQMLFDWSSSDKFNYNNFPAFSPSSGWVQGNFKKGMSGFVSFNYSDTKVYTINPYFFEWIDG